MIRAFDAGRPELTLTEVAGICGLTRAAARRFLLTLADLGYVRTDGRLFSLTPRVLELGYAYLSGLSLPDVATPHLKRLAAEVRESCALSILDHDDAVCVARAPAGRILAVTVGVGTRLPAYPTSIGRVLLAALPDAEREAYLARVAPQRLTARTVTDVDALRDELDRVRARGYALVDQELEEGLRAVAVPVRDRGGAVVGTVDISTHPARTTVDAMRRRFLPPLLAAARAIEADLRLRAP